MPSRDEREVPVRHARRPSNRTVLSTSLEDAPDRGKGVGGVGERLEDEPATAFIEHEQSGSGGRGCHGPENGTWSCSQTVPRAGTVSATR